MARKQPERATAPDVKVAVDARRTKSCSDNRNERTAALRARQPRCCTSKIDKPLVEKAHPCCHDRGQP
eukprot:7441441-Alexandrium_andersonii.AAC.1